MTDFNPFDINVLTDVRRYDTYKDFLTNAAIYLDVNKNDPKLNILLGNYKDTILFNINKRRLMNVNHEIYFAWYNDIIKEQLAQEKPITTPQTIKNTITSSDASKIISANTIEKLNLLQQESSDPALDYEIRKKKVKLEIIDSIKYEIFSDLDKKIISYSTENSELFSEYPEYQEYYKYISSSMLPNAKLKKLTDIKTEVLIDFNSNDKNNILDVFSIINSDIFIESLTLLSNPDMFCDIWNDYAYTSDDTYNTNFSKGDYYSVLEDNDTTIQLVMEYIQQLFIQIDEAKITNLFTDDTLIKEYISRDTTLYKAIIIKLVKMQIPKLNQHFIQQYNDTPEVASLINIGYYIPNVISQIIDEYILTIYDNQKKYIFSYQLLMIIYNKINTESTNEGNNTLIDKYLTIASMNSGSFNLVIEYYLYNIILKNIGTNLSSIKIFKNDNYKKRLHEYYNQLFKNKNLVLTYVKERNDAIKYNYGDRDINPRYQILSPYNSSEIDSIVPYNDTNKSDLINLNLKLKYFNYHKRIGFNDDDDTIYYNEEKAKTERQTIVNNKKLNDVIKTNKIYNYSHNNAVEFVNNNSQYIENYNLGTVNGYFHSYTTGEDIANSSNCGKVLLNKIINGEDIIIIGYGQSGAGKTSTLINLTLTTSEGDKREIPGVLPSIAKQLIDVDLTSSTDLDTTNIEKCPITNNTNHRYYKKAYCKLFNLYTKIDDVVKEIKDFKDTHYLPSNININNIIYNPNSEIEFFPRNINNITDWYTLNDKDEYISLGNIIAQAFDIREINPTKNNANSSRSHVIVCITFESVIINPETLQPCVKTSRVVVCDLAGVEDKFTCQFNEIIILDKNYAENSDYYKCNINDQKKTEAITNNLDITLCDNISDTKQAKQIEFDNYLCDKSPYNESTIIPLEILLNRGAYIISMYNIKKIYDNIKDADKNIIISMRNNLNYYYDKKILDNDDIKTAITTYLRENNILDIFNNPISSTNIDSIINNDNVSDIIPKNDFHNHMEETDIENDFVFQDEFINHMIIKDKIRTDIKPNDTFSNTCKNINNFKPGDIGSIEIPHTIQYMHTSIQEFMESYYKLSTTITDNSTYMNKNMNYVKSELFKQINDVLDYNINTIRYKLNNFIIPSHIISPNDLEILTKNIEIIKTSTVLSRHNNIEEIKNNKRSLDSKLQAAVGTSEQLKNLFTSCKTDIFTSCITSNYILCIGHTGALPRVNINLTMFQYILVNNIKDMSYDIIFKNNNVNVNHQCIRIEDRFYNKNLYHLTRNTLDKLQSSTNYILTAFVDTDSLITNMSSNNINDYFRKIPNNEKLQLTIKELYNILSSKCNSTSVLKNGTATSSSKEFELCNSFSNNINNTSLEDKFKKPLTTFFDNFKTLNDNPINNNSVFEILNNISIDFIIDSNENLEDIMNNPYYNYHLSNNMELLQKLKELNIDNYSFNDRVNNDTNINTVITTSCDYVLTDYFITKINDNITNTYDHYFKIFKENVKLKFNIRDIITIDDLQNKSSDDLYNKIVFNQNFIEFMFNIMKNGFIIKIMQIPTIECKLDLVFNTFNTNMTTYQNDIESYTRQINSYNDELLKFNDAKSLIVKSILPHIINTQYNEIVIQLEEEYDKRKNYLENNFTIQIKDYIRIHQLEYNCIIRRQEGYMINTSLREMQQFISSLILENAKSQFNNNIVNNNLIKLHNNDTEKIIYKINDIYKFQTDKLLNYNKIQLLLTKFNEQIDAFDNRETLKLLQDELFKTLNIIKKNILKELYYVLNFINFNNDIGKNTNKYYVDLSLILFEICFIDMLNKLFDVPYINTNSNSDYNTSVLENNNINLDLVFEEIKNYFDYSWFKDLVDKLELFYVSESRFTNIINIPSDLYIYNEVFNGEQPVSTTANKSISQVRDRSFKQAFILFTKVFDPSNTYTIYGSTEKIPYNIENTKLKNIKLKSNKNSLCGLSIFIQYKKIKNKESPKIKRIHNMFVFLINILKKNNFISSTINQGASLLSEGMINDLLTSVQMNGISTIQDKLLNISPSFINITTHINMILNFILPLLKSKIMLFDEYRNNIFTKVSKLLPLIYSPPKYYSDTESCRNLNNKYENEFALYNKFSNSNSSLEILFKIMSTQPNTGNKFGFGLNLSKATIVIFTVINLTPNPEIPVNNPPIPPFININKLKLIYKTILNSNVSRVFRNFNIILAKDDNKLTTTEKQTISTYGSLYDKINKYRIKFYDYLLQYPFYKIFIEAEPLSEYFINPNSFYDPTKLIIIINFIESNNAGTLIGTLDFEKFTQIRSTNDIYFICDGNNNNILKQAQKIDKLNKIDIDAEKLYIEDEKKNLA